MQSKKKRVVFVATKSELNTPSYYHRLWIAVRNIPISRRCWLDELANVFRDYDGAILHRTGNAFEMPDLDEAFADDPDLRWLGYYLACDKSGDFPRIQTRKYLRLQLLDLYFRIKHPKMAAHFAA